MMSREQAQQKISQIDKQINEIIANNPIAQASARPIAFPIMWWIAAIVMTAAYFLAGDFSDILGAQLTGMLKENGHFAAGGVGGLALLMTLRFIFFGRGKTAKSYFEAQAKLTELRKQRMIVEDQLKNG